MRAAIFANASRALSWHVTDRRVDLIEAVPPHFARKLRDEATLVSPE
jgi:short-subunit dehydrogenase involved in D-alanine esterification of teichoic acids